MFDKLTNLYSLTKTLRFELKPIGKTRENMNKQLKWDKNLQTFFKDQDIEDAYQTLKPFFDKFHEEFINLSLDDTNQARNINFSEYLKLYKEKEDLNKIEKKIRTEIEKAFIEAGEKWKKEVYPEFTWKKGSSEAKGADVLLSQDILELIKLKNKGDKLICNMIDVTFKGFYTYFSGFNQNRENYYQTKEEKSTAIATRIVHENLPKFCDNLIQFNYILKRNNDKSIEKVERKREYLNIYNYLKSKNIITQVRDSETGKMLELNDVKKDIFNISYFNNCLSQKGIDDYNKIIGQYNLLINLYNQAKESDEKNLVYKEKRFKRLPQFKTLYRQIGCGRKETLFFRLTHDTEIEAKENKEKLLNPYSVEEILKKAKLAGEKYFQGRSVEGVIDRIEDFREYVLSKDNDNYEGLYWSRVALNTVSNKYFANWYCLKEKFKNRKEVASFNKNREEQIKINDAVDLSVFFNELNQEKDWQKEGVLFKESLTNSKNGNDATKIDRRRNIISSSKNPSEALLKMILEDIKENANQFVALSDQILSLKNYKSENSKVKIKEWFDYAISVNQMLKYFKVREDKVKGVPLDANISEALNKILDSEDVEWFKWYDALRNYLTKKPQDSIKDNKLKLNFENSTLAGGWDVNKESDNYCVILQDNDNKQYLAIIAKGEKQQGYNKIFEKNDSNPLYKLNGTETWKKMEYDFWSDASKMIPKCSTQLREVIEHFKKSEDDYIFLEGRKVSSGERFTEKFVITKEIFDLNNKVYNKNNISVVDMRYNLKNNQEKNYIKSFQKEYWELIIREQNQNKHFTEQEINYEWNKFCNKKYQEMTELEKKYKDSLTKWINFCKYFISKYPKTKVFEYKFKDTSEYNSVDEFYTNFDICSYKLKMNLLVNKAKINDLVQDNRLYIFEIKNQDSNDGKIKNHKNNLHTIYWKALFKDIENKPKLNGQAEIFYRKALSENKLEKIIKKDKEIIKNFRFSREKFLFHVPITLNFCLKTNNINSLVNSSLQNNKCYVLGIDRGEKHLAYYSLIDDKGIIKDQGTLNIPFVDKNGKKRSIKKEKYFYNKIKDKWESNIVDCWDYNDLLDAMASNRDMARKNWKTIGTIKELKDGYVSQVVRKIADLAKDNNAVIVFEDLNVGFKRGRQKIEKSVYQKLELALAKKLNFLVDKSVEVGNVGSVTKALQLSPQVNNFRDIEKTKQLGIVFYTRANYTSQTDPVTGWRKTIYLKKGSEESIKKQILEEFTDFGFDGKDYYFDYVNKTMNKPWRLYSGKDGEQFNRFRGKRGDKNEWKNESIDYLKILNILFKNFDKNKSFYKQIKNKEVELLKVDGKNTAWESLRFVIDIIQQIRNTGEVKKDFDFLQSPVRDDNGNHFDTRLTTKNQPDSGDANGAYNIARKGLMVVKRIQNCKDITKFGNDNNGKSPENGYFVSDEAWDKAVSDWGKFVQNV